MTSADRLFQPPADALVWLIFAADRQVCRVWTRGVR